MTITITPTQLRAHIYHILDEVLETGASVEVLRRGKRVKLVAVEVPDKFTNLAEHPDYLLCDPEEIVHMDWFSEWDQVPKSECAP